MTARTRILLAIGSVLIILVGVTGGYWFVNQERLLDQGTAALQDGHYDRAIVIAHQVTFPSLRGRASRLGADARASKDKDQRLWDDYRDEARSSLLPANSTVNHDYTAPRTPGEDEYRKVNDDLLALLQRPTVARLSTSELRDKLGSYVRGNLVVTIDDLRPVTTRVRLVRLIVARSDAYRHDPCAKTVQYVIKRALWRSMVALLVASQMPVIAPPRVMADVPEPFAHCFALYKKAQDGVGRPDGWQYRVAALDLRYARGNLADSGAPLKGKADYRAAIVKIGQANSLVNSILGKDAAGGISRSPVCVEATEIDRILSALFRLTDAYVVLGDPDPNSKVDGIRAKALALIHPTIYTLRRLALENKSRQK